MAMVFTVGIGTSPLLTMKRRKTKIEIEISEASAQYRQVLFRGTHTHVYPGLQCKIFHTVD